MIRLDGAGHQPQFAPVPLKQKYESETQSSGAQELQICIPNLLGRVDGSTVRDSYSTDIGHQDHRGSWNHPASEW